MNLSDLELRAMWWALCEARDSLSTTPSLRRRLSDEIQGYDYLMKLVFEEGIKRGLDMSARVDWTAVGRKEG